MVDFEAPLLMLDGRSVAVTKPVMTIGRDAGNDVVIDGPSVSRHHAQLVRTPAGYTVEDLNSANGTSVGDRTLHGDRAPLADNAQMHIGDVPATFRQPRSAAVGGKTMLKDADQTVLGSANEAPAEAAGATEPLSARPRQRSGWALKQVPDERGERRWVLANTRTGRYLELDEREVFIWENLDGENTIRDLLYLYANEFGELSLPRIEGTLRALAGAELVRGLPDLDRTTRRSWPRRLGRAVFNALLKLEVSIKGIDGMVDRVYRAFGWRLFTRTAVVAMWLVIFGGLYAFWVAHGKRRLFDVGGAGAWGAVAVGVLFLGALAAHESVHALAVKSYGRRVTRGGFMLMMGMPYAFVDTSDMWFGSRWSRIVVTLSGPLSTAAVASCFAAVAAYVPIGQIAGIAYQLAFALYLNTLYNLNPLMPLDGYQALADALRIPKLRENATSYALKGFWRDLAARRRPGLREVGLAGYGLAVAAATYLFLILGIIAWRSRIGGWAHHYLPAPFDTVALVALIGLVMFPVWFRFARKAIALVRRSRRPRADVVPAPAG
jgi:putative peptide zinc metalloprotease protein